MSRDLLEQLMDGVDLEAAQADALMGTIMDGEVPPARIAALLTALRIKGETVAELTGFAQAMRSRSLRVDCARDGLRDGLRDDLVDTCGTGGDARGTFNISTATALLAAAMGIPVAKHGNRAVSSHCGSADVLEALGVNIDLPPARIAELIDEIGIGFLYAPAHHPAMRHAGPVRRELGVRTVFNLLGPLTNPAGVRRQLLGVFAEQWTEPIAQVLAALGSEEAAVVHGHDGTDEISITGPTTVSRLEAGAVYTVTVTPEEAGLERGSLADLAGGSAGENAARIEAILGGVNKGSADAGRDAVLLNAGFVAMIAGRARMPAEGVALARDAIDSGAAAALLQRLRLASHEPVREAS